MFKKVSKSVLKKYYQKLIAVRPPNGLTTKSKTVLPPGRAATPRGFLASISPRPDPPSRPPTRHCYTIRAPGILGARDFFFLLAARGQRAGGTGFAAYFLLLVPQSGFCGFRLRGGEAYRAGRPGEGMSAAGPCARRGYFSGRTAIPSGGDAYLTS